jgi:hypothetical protein
MRQHGPGPPPGDSQTERLTGLPPWWKPGQMVRPPTPSPVDGELALDDLAPATSLAETSLELRALAGG